MDLERTLKGENHNDVLAEETISTRFILGRRSQYKPVISVQ
jgi:hypothetical protein